MLLKSDAINNASTQTKYIRKTKKLSKITFLNILKNFLARLRFAIEKLSSSLRMQSSKLIKK